MSCKSPHLTSWLAALVAALAAAAPTPAQDDALTPPPNGMRRLESGWHRLVGATLHVSPTRTIEDGALVVRDGAIVYAGESPAAGGWAAVGGAGAREWDCSGLHLYAGLVDAHVEVAAPQPEAGSPGRHWNARVTPERSVLDGTGIPEKEREELRALGFAAAVASPEKGIFRGFAALVSLAEDPAEASHPRPPVYRDAVYQAIAFETGGRRRGGGGSRSGMGNYPGSQMGAIALIRQVLADVHHRRATGADEPNSLAHLQDADGLTRCLFDGRDELESLRAAEIAAEFDVPALLLGSGTEFRRLAAVTDLGLPIILPLAFPEAPDVSSVGAAESVSLRALMTWEQAPTNPRRLDAEGVPVLLTTAKLDQRKQFRKNLLAAIEHGLDADRALAMLTTVPAEVLGVADRLGTLEAGRIANVVVADGPLFGEETRLLEVWVDGRRHELAPREENQLTGLWSVTLEPSIEDPITFTFRSDKKLDIEVGDADAEAQDVSFADGRLSFVFEHEPFGEPGRFTLSGLLDEEVLRGHGKRADGRRFAWRAERTSREVPEKEREKKGDDDEGEDVTDAESENDEEEAAEETVASAPEELGLPFGAYMLAAPPEQAQFVELKGGTIWTCGDAGIIENGSVVIARGKIAYVGGPYDGDRPEGARTIDVTGKHLTPGLIDCHSHTGISRGVNESGQSVTAEVRIGDVTNPDDVDWYRQLAGGLTAASSLHGSANPIGGQNQVNKLRWGCAHPDDMHFAGASPGIKFALGENVKQSNWGSEFRVRYPQTRMGVETLMRDRFVAAREYARAWAAFEADGGPQPRRDLELEALAEILAGERLIHCHSYRQDEILMLCRLAEEFDFKIGTFQHILEGYKVAEAIRANAIGASAFSDWWGYKLEVQDAIPYAGAIMHDTGIVTSFNSDSDELARRMNLEAAKAVKWGGVPPEEALKFVTLNPAIQLKIDDRVGSIETRKDADLVVWSGDPLSTLTRCEATWIDGREYFSIERDRELREQNARERRRLVQKILGLEERERLAGRGSSRSTGHFRRLNTADRFAWILRRERNLELLRAGLNLDEVVCGDCGLSTLGHAQD